MTCQDVKLCRPGEAAESIRLGVTAIDGESPIDPEMAGSHASGILLVRGHSENHSGAYKTGSRDSRRALR